MPINDPPRPQSRTLNFWVALWFVITLFYACSALGFVVPFPFGLLTSFIFNVTGLTVPISLMYFPTTLNQLPFYDASSSSENAAIWLTLLVINFIGVIFSYVALIKLRKNWR